jgi:hypothetical protein
VRGAHAKTRMEEHVAEQKQRTEAGVRRYHSVREHAKTELRRKMGGALAFLTEDDLVKMLTDFALDEMAWEKRIMNEATVTAHRVGEDPRVATISAEAEKILGTFREVDRATMASAIAADATCFAKAQAKGEPTFTLRAQDLTAPQTILFWMGLNAETLTHHKLSQAGSIAATMRDWPHRKRAD